MTVRELYEWAKRLNLLDDRLTFSICVRGFGCFEGYLEAEDVEIVSKNEEDNVCIELTIDP